MGSIAARLISTDVADEFRSGWRLLLVAMLGCGLGVSSLPLYTAGVFFPSLQAEFGWSRTQLSTAILAFTLTLAIASPVIGYLIDKLGMRRAVSFSIIAAAACYGILSVALSNLTLYYVLHMGIAALGAAAAPVAYTKIITGHFQKSRGLALGITLLGPSLVATISPALISVAITAKGWQGGYLLLAVLTGAMLPVLFLFTCREGNAESQQTFTHGNEINLYGKNEIRRIFSVLGIALGLFSLGIGGLIVHFVPILTDSGLELIDAARIAGLLGFAGMVGRIIGGALADRMFAPFILVAVAVAASLGCAILAVEGVMFAVPVAILLGFSLGTEADLMGYLVSRYFGRQAYGKIFGWQYAIFIVGVGLSPLMLGHFYDLNNDYRFALCVSSFLLLAAAGCFWMLPPFRDAI